METVLLQQLFKMIKLYDEGNNFVVDKMKDRTCFVPTKNFHH